MRGEAGPASSIETIEVSTPWEGAWAQLVA